MTDQVVLRPYDHKAYTVVRGGRETAAFLIANHAARWELRLRPAGPLVPAGPVVRVFARLGHARDWLRSDDGQAWLNRTGEVT